MSDHDHTTRNSGPEGDSRETLFKNPDTVLRRAWIERALAGVRQRMDAEQGIPALAIDGAPEAVGAAEAETLPKRPQLYLVRGGKGG